MWRMVAYCRMISQGPASPNFQCSVPHTCGGSWTRYASDGGSGLAYVRHSGPVSLVGQRVLIAAGADVNLVATSVDTLPYTQPEMLTYESTTSLPNSQWVPYRISHGSCNTHNNFATKFQNVEREPSLYDPRILFPQRKRDNDGKYYPTTAAPPAT